jgi:hypothetical protein
MAKKKQPKAIKKVSGQDGIDITGADVDFNEKDQGLEAANPVVIAHSGVVIQPFGDKQPKYLQALDGVNVDKLKREAADEEEMANEIADLSNVKKVKVVEKPAHIQEAPASAVTDAQKIWAEIQNLPIEMFGLPNQVVRQYCNPVDLVPTMCFLKQSFSSVLPMLELAVGQAYTCEMQGTYVVVKRAVKPL